ncbi:MAG: S8 family serine peptidase [Janthinobacterium lividum]
MKTTTRVALAAMLLGALGHSAPVLAQDDGPAPHAASALPQHTAAHAPYVPYQRTDPASPIGGELQRLYARWAGTQGQRKARPTELQATFPHLQLGAGGTTVLVTITGSDTQALQSLLAERRVVVVSSYPELHFVEGFVPMAQLAPGAAGLAGLTRQGLQGVAPVHRGMVGARAGAGSAGTTPTRTRATRAGRFTSITSTVSGTPYINQADYLLQTDRVRALGGFDGRGVRIGLLSGSYNTDGAADADILAGELPPQGVLVLQDDSIQVSEGENILQSIYDMAPGASLAFSSVTQSGEGDYATQIRRLADPTVGNCRILIDNVTPLEEPIYQDGVVAQAINEVVQQRRVAYFSSARNDGDDGYENTAPKFVALPRSNGAAQLNFNTTGSGAVGLSQHYSIQDGEQVYKTILWSDPFYTSTGPGVQTDLDAYLISSRGDTVAASTDNNRQNRRPVEMLDFTNDFSQTHTTDFYLHLVKRAGTATPARIHIRMFGNTPLDWLTHSATCIGHPATVGAMAVAAAPFFDPTQPEPFTSKGGNTYLFDPKGNPLAVSKTVAKPDLTGVDGVTNNYLGLNRVAGNDFGTSLSAPIVAAVAAVLWQAKPALTVAQLYARLASTAHDIAAPGTDDLTGAGLVDAFAAVYGPVVPAVPTATQPWLDDVERGSLSRAWDVSATGPARPWVRQSFGPASGRYHLIIDASAQDGAQFSSLPANIGAATLHANLSGAAASGWYLTFKHKIIAGETKEQLPAKFSSSAVGDGVSLSTDGGLTWYRLVDLTTATTTTYQTLSVNLTQFARTNKLTLSTDVRLRFQQSGATSVDATGGPTPGGRAFDDIVLTANPAGAIPLFVSTTPTADCPALSVTFTDASANAPASLPRRWSFPGGSPATSTALSPTVLYPRAGRYDVTLTVGSGTTSVTHTDSAYVQIAQRPPVPTATVNHAVTCPLLPVQFTASSRYCATSYRWRFPGGFPASSTFATPLVSYFRPGVYPVTLIAQNTYGVDSTIALTVRVAPSLPLPAAEGFPLKLPAYWDVVNPDGAISWISYPAVGPDGTYGGATGVNCYDYTSVGQRDYLLSVPVSLPVGSAHPLLRFSVAYAPHPETSDSLLVRVLTRCAPHLVLGTVYRKGGPSLGTVAAQYDQFFPASADQWRTETVDLAAYRGLDVVLAFETYNANGNIIWMDDFSVSVAKKYNSLVSDNRPTTKTTTDADAGSLSVWPNPVAGSGTLTVETPASPALASLRLLDELGRTVWQGTAPASDAASRQTVPVPGGAGLYILHYTPASGLPLMQKVAVQ